MDNLCISLWITCGRRRGACDGLRSRGVVPPLAKVPFGNLPHGKRHPFIAISHVDKALYNLRLSHIATTRPHNAKGTEDYAQDSDCLVVRTLRFTKPLPYKVLISEYYVRPTLSLADSQAHKSTLKPKRRGCYFNYPLRMA